MLHIILGIVGEVSFLSLEGLLEMSGCPENFINLFNIAFIAMFSIIGYYMNVIRELLEI